MIDETSKVIGIMEIISGALLILIGMVDYKYDWGTISFICGTGFLVVGILDLLKKTTKVRGVLRIVFGGLMIGVALLCDLDYDWGYVGLFAGVAFLILGIMMLAKRIGKATSILQIVFGGILILFSFGIKFEYDWGLEALIAGVPLLVSGIMELVKMGKENNNLQEKKREETFRNED